jgi:hypothetical protein
MLGEGTLSDEDREVYWRMREVLWDDSGPDDQLLTIRLVESNFRPDALHVWGSSNHPVCH